MAFNLRNRSFLKEIDTEVKHLKGTVGRAPRAVREIWSCLAPGHDRQREAGCPQVVLACSWGSSIRAEVG